tara:strand:+ start:317 stop:481 length:165 start_codon:yes stop_codon:yes gene_type:complete
MDYDKPKTTKNFNDYLIDEILKKLNNIDFRLNVITRDINKIIIQLEKQNTKKLW